MQKVKDFWNKYKTPIIVVGSVLTLGGGYYLWSKKGKSKAKKRR